MHLCASLVMYLLYAGFAPAAGGGFVSLGGWYILQDTPDEVAGSYACRGLTAYSALKKADLKQGQNSVVIISAGGLGLLSLKIIQAAYSINPIVVDIDDDKLDLAKKAGASAVINSKDDSIIQITHSAIKWLEQMMIQNWLTTRDSSMH